jgi:branched-subunit amino acid aminotransferase/4-amino-4-deoxychorismate lyase
LKVVERTIMLVDLAAMDEAFLTNALMGIMPLTKVDGQDVGAGKPGTVTLGMQKILNEG